MAKNDLLKGSSDSLLLRLLEQKPMYGYQIIKELEARSRGFLNSKKALSIRLFTVWRKQA